MNNKPTMKFSTFLRTLGDTFEIIELRHAWRINGVIDIYRNKTHVFCLESGERNNFKDITKLFDYVTITLNKYPFVDRSKVKDPDKPNYGEFERKVMPTAKTSIQGFKPENYHWDLLKEEKSDTHLYFLFHDGFVKIGKTKNIDNRLKQLKTGLSCSYYCYLIPNMGSHERKFHHIFEDFRHNREWFVKDIRHVEFIKKLYSEGRCQLFQQYNRPNKETYKEQMERKLFENWMSKLPY